jgi:SAM-dependent methyltransferase
VSRVQGWLSERRRELDDWLDRHDRTHTFSLATWSLHERTAGLLDAFARGRVLDAGAGRAPYARALRRRGLDVVVLDIEDRSGEVDLIADVQHMPEIASESVDTLLCSQVIEHLPRPWDALGEMARTLRPGGTLILSAPHLSAIHEAPHDYYRYTRFGLTALLEQAGFEVLEAHASGGLLCFLAHPLSFAWHCSIGALPGLRAIAWLANYLILVRLLAPVDRLIGLPSVFPCDTVVLARRPGGN